MTRQDVFTWIREQYGIEADYPFSDDVVSAVFRHPTNKKWFALLMTIPKKRVGLDGTDFTDIMNVKCDPFLIGSLIDNVRYFRAYHMNKEKWLSVRLYDGADDEQVKMLIDMSFGLTEEKGSRV